MKKLYDEKKIQTNIPKTVLKELLYICAKQLHFTFNNNIYIQFDGVTISSPLGPLLAKIPTLKSCLCNWKRHADDTRAYVKPTKAEFILNKLNNYLRSINFKFELEKNNEINFLKVLIKRVNNNELKTSVYQKSASTDICINCKIERLRKLIK